MESNPKIKLASKKNALVILSIVILAGLIFFIFFALFSRKTVDQTAPPIAEDLHVSLPPQAKPLETPGTYLIAEFPQKQAPSEAVDYSIVYIDDGNYYIISILKRPLEKTRLDAEDAFLKALSIGRDEACALNVSLGTIASVDQNLSGQNFGLSFCPGSIRMIENAQDSGDIKVEE